MPEVRIGTKGWRKADPRGWMVSEVPSLSLFLENQTLMLRLMVLFACLSCACAPPRPRPRPPIPPCERDWCRVNPGAACWVVVGAQIYTFHCAAYMGSVPVAHNVVPLAQGERWDRRDSKSLLVVKSSRQPRPIPGRGVVMVCKVHDRVTARSGMEGAGQGGTEGPDGGHGFDSRGAPSRAGGKLP